jgi:hypothetical protein
MSGGFGFFGAGGAAAGPADVVPGVTPTTLVASWLIDTVYQRYVLDSNGNPLGMDGTDQRVYGAVCGADTDVAVITPTTLNQQASALRAALRPLVIDGSITGLSVSATDDGKATSLKTILYQNAGTNLNVTLRIR